MSDGNNGVKWYGQRVRGEIAGATEAAIRKIALDIEAGAKLAITDNDQIDTGFMRNSVYTHTKQSGVMGGAQSGRFASRRSGQTVPRVTAGPAPLEGADAIVGVGAVYAIWQELRRSFLRVSFERVVKAAGGTVKGEFQSRGF